MKRFLIPILLVLSLGACSTVTQETVNKPELKPQISKTITSEPFKGLKRKVAIVRFSNETKRGNSFLLGDSKDKIGKQAMDILSARLTETGKFLLFERADLGEIKTEQNIARIPNSVVGADYLIVGSVSALGRKAVSDVGIFSRNLKQMANATVNIRLIDVKTGQIVYSEEGSGTSMSEANRVFGVGSEAGYDASIEDRALSAAITKLVSNLVENLMDKPWAAYILDDHNGRVIISGGKSQGLKIGDRLRVMRHGRMVKNPQTGMKIELPRVEIARLTVTGFAGSGKNEISYCRITKGNLSRYATKNLVVQDNEARK